MAIAITMAAMAATYPAQSQSQTQTQTVLVAAPENTDQNNGKPTLVVLTNSSNPSSVRTDGAFIAAKGGANNYGFMAYAEYGSNYNNGILGVADSAGITGVGVLGISHHAVSSNYGVYGQAYGGAYNWAGYFDGNVYTTGSYLPSDEKLKKNIQPEESILAKIKQLTPVSYNYKSEEISYMHLPKNLQHGFLAQDLQSVFPELVTQLEQPVYVKNRYDHAEKIMAVNYTMLIPALTKAIQEQQTLIEALQDRINALSPNTGSVATLSGVSLAQNAPNPAGSSSEIKYSIPAGVGNASIGVFDLTGKMLMQYNNLTGSSQLTIDNSRLAAGIYIYSLLINGQEAVSKKMVILK